MKDNNYCDSSATLPPKKSGYRHFYKRHNDGTIEPVTFRPMSKMNAYEHAGRIYKPELIEAMIHSGTLYPASTTTARIYTIKANQAA